MNALHHLPNDIISTADADHLYAAEEILMRRMSDGQLLSNPEDAGRLLRMRLGAQPREVFTAIFLDCRHRVIEVADMFFGTIDGCEVHPREIARKALALNAAAVIVGHNHPSGNPEPSAADRAITTRIKTGLALFEIRLLDHFVVGQAGSVSLAARGWV